MEGNPEYWYSLDSHEHAGTMTRDPLEASYISLLEVIKKLESYDKFSRVNKFYITICSNSLSVFI